MFSPSFRKHGTLSKKQKNFHRTNGIYRVIDINYFLKNIYALIKKLKYFSEKIFANFYATIVKTIFPHFTYKKKKNRFIFPIEHLFFSSVLGIPLIQLCPILNFSLNKQENLIFVPPNCDGAQLREGEHESKILLLGSQL